MNTLVLSAHPCDESFGAALRRTIIDTLSARGWSVDDCDLYAEEFQPILSPDERRRYHDIPANIEPVRQYVDRLRAADALILCFPVWNFGYPAILKGFFDRVFLPGVSFRLENGQVQPNLTNIQKLAAVTTYGGTRFRAFLAGDPPRKIVKRHLWHVTRPTRTSYVALYDMNRATDPKRTGFLDRVRREMEAL
ncbi:MAG: NAD(P)H-dependent oxidoreductase [Silicimonas sp.]|nr:NAD(P)H-dependent oxidoreductase [Silicimonas sp.]RZW12509.1 MAG: flavodoxin family protein [Paracoccaceae bacterium]